MAVIQGEREMSEERNNENPRAAALRALYSKTAQRCRDNIRALIREGDHMAVWDEICDGPDAGKHGGTIISDKGRRVPFGLSGADRVGMSEELANYARQAGWNEAACNEAKALMIRQRRGAVKGAVADLRAPGAGRAKP
jgi:hypothetical protein